MAKTRAVIGYLAAFYIGDSNSPIGYTKMLEVKSINPALFTVPVVDATHLESPNATEEKLPGLIKPGTLDIVANFVGDASQLSISTLAQLRTVFPWKTTAPCDNGTKTQTLTGVGFISKYEPGPYEASKLNECRFAMEIAGNIVESVA